RGAETGVKAVQCLEGDAMWKAIDDGIVRKDLLDAALTLVPKKDGDVRNAANSALFVFEYNDGFRGAIVMLPEYSGGTSIALKLNSEKSIIATRFDEQTE